MTTTEKPVSPRAHPLPRSRSRRSGRFPGVGASGPGCAIHFLPEDRGDFRSGKLGRERLIRPQQVADLGAAQDKVVARVVRAGLRRHDASAGLAIERVVKAQDRYANLTRPKFVKDKLCIVRAVVIADASVVASDDKVGAAVVLANQRV